MNPAAQLALGWIALLLAACTQGGLEDLCDAACACEGCNEEGRRSCNDDSMVRETAVRNQCEDTYNAWLSCAAGDGTCQNGRFDVEACGAENQALRNCMCVGLFHSPPRISHCQI